MYLSTIPRYFSVHNLTDADLVEITNRNEVLGCLGMWLKQVSEAETAYRLVTRANGQTTLK